MYSVLLMILLSGVLHDWHSSNEIHVPDITINLEEIYHDTSIIGRVEFTNTLATGLATLPYDKDHYGAMLNVTEEDESGNNDACVKDFVVNDFEFSTDYFVDVALFDQIPIYGEGTIKINLKDLNAEMCFYAISNGGDSITGLENMVVHIKYKDGPVSITGAMNNPQANEIFNQLFELAHVFVAMWHNYDPQAECLFSPVLEYLSNVHLGHLQPNSTANFIDCFTKGTPFGDLTTDQIKLSINFILELFKMIS